jgi:hypothetical protein
VKARRKETIRKTKTRHMSVDNITMDLREMGWVDMDCIVLVQVRDQRRALVNTVMKLRVPQNSGKFLNSCTTGGFSRKNQFHEVSVARKAIIK